MYDSGKYPDYDTLYDLDVLLSIGYRVNNNETTQFRLFSSQILKECLTKGFALDDERLKGNKVFGTEYFEDLLDRIREIRLSDRKYYQKITDVFSKCSSDYDTDDEMTQLFFKIVLHIMQNVTDVDIQIASVIHLLTQQNNEPKNIY